jgi:photosystem II stability/assembly factor-like uncharacterized protein
MRACVGFRVGSLVAITAGSALSLAGLLAPGAAWAATGSWSPLGPDGGPVTSLAIDPAHAGTIYAGTQLGYVFKSTSAGANWAAASPMLAYLQVGALAIDPANPTTLYAGTESGLFKTVDGAGTWSLVITENYAPGVSALAVDPVHTATLFAATGSGLKKSTDGGASWSTVDPTTSVHVLAIDRAHPATVWAGYDAGIFKSSDGGASWSDAPGLPLGSFEALAIDPANPATVYAGGGAYYGVPGMVKTSDGGATWTAINSGLPVDFSVAALAIDPAMPATVYTSLRGGGVFKTTDGGASWTAIGASLAGLDVYALAIDATNPDLLFAGTVAGVFKSTDAGASWGAVDTGLAALQVSTMAIDPVSSATLYVGTAAQGVFKSVDSGASWTAASSGLASLDSLVVYALVIDPTNTATLYAGTQAGVFKTSDAARSWTAVNSGLPIYNLYTSSLAIDPIHPATLYAATGLGVWKTTDGGASWTEANAGNFSGSGVLVIDPTTPATLYSAYSGVSKSTDGGASWTDVSSGLGNIGLGSFIQALAIDPAHPATLYAATNRGVAKTTDGGASWHAVNCGLPPHPDNYFSGLAIDPAHPGTLYTGYAGIFKSTDGGASWTAMPGGALSGILVLGLTFDPKTSTLYAATSGRSVFALTGGAPPNPTTMQCIDDFAGDARFQLTVHFHTRQGGGQSGNGQPIPLSSLGVSHGGLFWFFSPGNPEMLVKVLDACFTAQKFWVFYSAGTNVAFTTTVRDNRTGVVRTYTNPDLTPAPPIQDTNAFDCSYDIPRPGGDQNAAAGEKPWPLAAMAARAKVEPAWPAAPAPAAPTAVTGDAPRSFRAAAGGCSAGPSTLCIDGRFQVEVAYRTTQGGGRSGMGQAIPLTSLGVDQGGLFWFFDAGNPEMLIKVVDGCSLTGKYWVFASAGTNVGLKVTVTDTQTGSSATYINPDLTAAPPIQDTAALPCG